MHGDLNLLEAIEKFEEKGIKKDVLIDILLKSIKSAYKKNYGTKNVDIVVDPKSTGFVVYQTWLVVEDVQDPNEELCLEEALKINPKATLGTEIKKKINLKKDFNRIAAQTAKQVILQNLKELEKKALFDKYVSFKDKVTVAEVLKSTELYTEIRIGKLETKLPQKDMIPGEKLQQGDLIKVHVVDIQKSTKGPKILVSRTTNELVIHLLKSVVPEIDDGVVEIVKIYREPGIRTKIAVKSNSKQVDAVGACVGENSSRILELYNELNNEKIDIIQYSEDIEVFIKNSLAPAEVKKIEINNEKREAKVFVPKEQFSLAIGKGGQTARSAAKLTAWKIDIHEI